MNRMKIFRGAWIGVLALGMVFISSVARAGTVGMAGVWDFTGEARAYDSATGVLTANILSSSTVAGVSGRFNFDSNTVEIISDDPFLGFHWTANGSIADNLDGTYTGDLLFSWSTATAPFTILWDITDNLDGTASVVTLDADLNGIPGNDVTTGILSGYSIAIDGTLTAVPVPGAALLLGSGLLGLMTAIRRKKSGR